MTTSLQFNISLPNVLEGGNADWRFVPILMALECLTTINQWHWRRGAAIPLAESKAIYQEEPPGREDWDDCVKVAKRGWGDCEDLAAYLAAELRETQGIRAECVIKYRFIPSSGMRSLGYPPKYIPTSGAYLIHVLVRLPNGNILDPSEMLGMKKWQEFGAGNILGMKGISRAHEPDPDRE